MFWCGPASLPEAVLAAAQVWQSLAGWQRLEFASRQAQVCCFARAGIALSARNVCPLQHRGAVLSCQLVKFNVA